MNEKARKMTREKLCNLLDSPKAFDLLKMNECSQQD
jgi:hypothetical protein